ncbi:TonB-dependent receptor [Chryseobacterium sp. Chry.R1]|uniref:TonB-dependent receptor n=1 Tax=Chryseobacterium sp. Chry.R1 TaxID=3139392 RepID=UPI0031F7B23F
MKFLFRIIIIIISFMISSNICAQTLIKGRVLDESGKRLEGVNIFVKGTVDGTFTNSNGDFVINTTSKDIITIVLKHELMDELQQEVNIDTNSGFLQLIMKKKDKEIEEVVIMAGNFGVGDKNKSSVLSSMDVETTAGTDGDITGSLRTLPGTQQIGESGALFVRGGSGDETKVMIDELNIFNPFLAGVPDIAQRNRFSPHLFKGIIFNTGGYSSKYGDALSSVLTLETKSHPLKSSSVIALLPYGGQLGHNFLNKKKDMSVNIDLGYSNFNSYYKMIPQKVEWLKAPESGTLNVNFRKSTKGNGMIKWYGYGNWIDQSINYTDIENPENKFPYQAKNINTISLLTYTRDITDKWKVYMGYGLNFDNSQITEQNLRLKTKTVQHQLRFSLIGNPNKWMKLYLGAEGFNTNIDTDTLKNKKQLRFRDQEIALWLELDIKFSNNFIIRPGLRTEYNEFLKRSVYLPRLSLAYKTSQYTQLNVSVGEYAQKPQSQLLINNSDLNFMRSTHYIIDFQYMKAKQIFRLESYYKNYDKLLITSPKTENSGKGYATGIDIFWRDSKTIKGLDYWISYSWLNTKRYFMDYPISTRPTFASPHTAHIVTKYFLENIGLFIGGTYSVAAGRTYYNPNNPVFLGDKTPSYHNLNFNIALLRKWGLTFNTFVLAVNNVLGNNQIFNYRFSRNGKYNQAIELPYKRSFMIGWFISIGENRSKEVLEQLP